MIKFNYDEKTPSYYEFYPEKNIDNYLSGKHIKNLYMTAFLNNISEKKDCIEQGLEKLKLFKDDFKAIVLDGTRAKGNGRRAVKCT